MILTFNWKNNTPQKVDAAIFRADAGGCLSEENDKNNGKLSNNITTA